MGDLGWSWSPEEEKKKRGVGVRGGGCLRSRERWSRWLRRINARRPRTIPSGRGPDRHTREDGSFMSLKTAVNINRGQTRARADCCSGGWRKRGLSLLQGPPAVRGVQVASGGPLLAPSGQRRHHRRGSTQHVAFSAFIINCQWEGSSSHMTDVLGHKTE